MKTTSFRTCVVCRKKEEPCNFIRITRVNNDWFINNDNKLQGRSIYLHQDIDHINRFKNQKQRFNINDENFECLIKELENLL